ncbi:hypothetical protein ACWD5F_10040 [Streptomyces sp. NPDC002499]
MAERQWHYEVRSEPSAIELENIRFLAGCRRPWLFDPDLLDELRSTDLDGIPLRQAASRLAQRSESIVRAAVHHLLRSRERYADLTELLCPSSVLRRTAKTTGPTEARDRTPGASCRRR